MYHSAIAAPGIEIRWGDDNPCSFSGMRNGRIIEVYLPGCNLKCEFCIAPYLTNLGDIRGIQWIEATDLVRAASGAIDALLFSGGEASIHVDYVTDVFSKCQDQKIKTCLETNGYMTKKTAQKLAPHTDYIAVGLKASLDPTFYKRRLGIKETQPIFETMKTFAENHCELMLTNVTDPNLWEDMEAFKTLTTWVAQNLGPSTPLVISPMERIEVPPPFTDERVYVTPLQQREAHVQQCQKLALDAGLHRVFRQVNVRRIAEEFQQRLEKTGISSTLKQLGMSPP
jgi:pyruvate formate lyase activating enzyme